MTIEVTRPVVRWFGGKWVLAPWIVEHFPPHRVYVEPFGGGASVLLHKPRSYAEIYNDLDREVVNLFRVLRDDALAERLVRGLELTPFSRDELHSAYEPGARDDIERARSLIVRSFMGFGSNSHARNSADTLRLRGLKGLPTGFRGNSNRSGTTPAHDWRNYPDALAATIERLRGVVIENRDALRVMSYFDGVDVLHYLDPPYIIETRGPESQRANRGYDHDMTNADHEALLAFVHGLQGYVVISGYDHPLYNFALSDWHRIEKATYADGARARTEVLWLNPRARDAQQQRPLPFLDGPDEMVTRYHLPREPYPS